MTDDGGRKLVVATEVNLSRLHSGLESAKDASFEAECAIEVLQGLSNLLRLPCDEGVLKQLRETASRQPRFTIRMMQRTVDVPDHADPGIPEAEHFKLARKELAIVLREQGVAVPARYELEPAKQIMNAAREAMRQGCMQDCTVRPKAAAADLRRAARRADRQISARGHSSAAQP